MIGDAGQVIDEAAAYLRGQRTVWPSVAVVLGSAQAAFVPALEERQEIAYTDIPDWPVPTVAGHAGKLIIGKVRGRLITVMSGRVHLYEGWTPQEVVFGVRVLGRLGLKNLILTNAAGGINPAYRRGMLVLITDHINLQGGNPLLGPNDDKMGPRFPDMTCAYSPALRELAKAAAADVQVEIGEGVYAGLLGPSFETPAEIRVLRTIGADLAGMSTIAETIAARHMGINVLGISTVTNMAAGMQAELSHAEVLEIGRSASGVLIRLLSTLIPRIA
jgi:purine-nucleoside phosphorylase